MAIITTHPKKPLFTFSAFVVSKCNKKFVCRRRLLGGIGRMFVGEEIVCKLYVKAR